MVAALNQTRRVHSPRPFRSGSSSYGEELFGTGDAVARPATARAARRGRAGLRAFGWTGTAIRSRACKLDSAGSIPSDHCCFAQSAGVGLAVEGDGLFLVRGGDRLRRGAAIGEDRRVSSRVDRLAYLAVDVGVNVQAGQDFVVLAFDVEQAPVARAVADAAYVRGARFRQRRVLGSAREALSLGSRSR